MITPIARASERATPRWMPLQMLAPAALALWSAGCGGPAVASATTAASGASDELPAATALIRLPPGQPFFVPGETMAFQLSYGGILTGRAAMAVGQPGEIDGRAVLIVRSQFETAGAAKLLATVRDNIDTRLDWHTGVPIEHRGEASGSKRATASVRFEGQRTHIEYQREGKPRLELDVSLPEGEIMHDMHSILGALRAWEPAPGEVAYFYSVSGRRVWRTDLAFRGSTTVRTAMGLRAALHFTGSSTRLHHRSLDPDRAKQPRGVELWISDDAHRMPLRVVAHSEYGDFQAELVSYQRPDQQVSSN